LCCFRRWDLINRVTPVSALRSEPRWPSVPAKAGHYESFFVKACHPDGGLGVWIRHTVHKAPGRPAVGSVWFVLFDAAGNGPLASKVTAPPEALGAGAGEYIHIGDSRLEDGRAVGSAPSSVAQPRWELEFAAAEAPYRHLPRGWMYRAPLPKTKLLSPYPNATFRGTVTVDGRAVELDGWPGTIGHNWGAQHAERWIWLHGARFDGQDDAWFDGALGRIKVGPVTVPWIGNGRLRVGGEDLVLGGIERTRSTTVREAPDRCTFTLTGAGATVRGEVSAPRKDFVGWVYADPDGSEHNTVNCSIATMTLTVERPGRPTTTLTCSGGAAYELGMRETDHGIPLQPFPDP
jgi:hypothetical protein